jgi:tetratricopeptide (TPR) repeat protein
MTLLATILFSLSLLVLVGMFLSKLGQVHQRPMSRIKIASDISHDNLAFYFRRKISMASEKLWHFILEAKDLKPATTKSLHDQVERVKAAFRIRIRTSEKDPHWLPEATELGVKTEESPHSPEESYLEAIKRDPSDRQAYEALGRLYLQNKNFPDAVETFDYLTKLDPSKDTYFSNLGLCYYSLQDYQNAAVAYEKAVTINAKVPTRWVNLALCYDALDQPSKAIKALVQACSLDKLNVGFMMLLAEAYIKIENFVRAEEILEQVLSLEPTNGKAREKLMKLKI